MKVPFEELDDAFLFDNYEMSSWLDKKRGKSILITPDTTDWLENKNYFQDEEEKQAAREILSLIGELESDEEIDKADEDRYLQLPQQNSNDDWQTREDFSFTVKNERLQEKLLDALHDRKPFQGFKQLLSYYDKEEQDWYTYENETRCRHIIEWAESENIEIDFDK